MQHLSRNPFSHVFIFWLIGAALLSACGSRDPANSGARSAVEIGTELIAKDVYDAENIAVNGNGEMYVSSADYLYVFKKTDPAGTYASERLIDLKAIYAGLAIGPGNQLYAICYKGLHSLLLRIDLNGKEKNGGRPYKVLLKGTVRIPNGLRMNDDGRLYAADYGWILPGTGKIWEIRFADENGETSVHAKPVATGLSGPNGICIDRERGRLYFTETLSGRIQYLEKEPDGEYGGAPTLLADFSLSRPMFTILDDFALDAEGNLHVCHYNGNQILVVSPEGELVRRLKPSGIYHPTAIAFAGGAGDSEDLYITQKGHMLIRDKSKGDRISRMPGEFKGYRLPFAELNGQGL